MFERIWNLGLEVPNVLYPYRITYDIECLLSKEQLPEGTDKVTYTSRHELLSVSICSNVPGHDTPACLVRSVTVQELVNDFVDKLETIACCVEKLLSSRLDGALCSLWALVRQRKEAERAYLAHGSREGRAAVKTMTVRRFLRQLLQWICAVQVVGFNFQCYDLNVPKSALVRRLVCVDTGDVGDGGDGDDINDDDGDNGNNESDGTTSCSGSDSGVSDDGEAGD